MLFFIYILVRILILVRWYVVAAVEEEADEEVEEEAPKDEAEVQVRAGYGSRRRCRVLVEVRFISVCFMSGWIDGCIWNMCHP